MKTNTTKSIALVALFTSSLAFADTEVSGKITIEHAGFMTPGSTIGNVGTSFALGSAANGPAGPGDCTMANMFNNDGTPNMSNPYCGVATMPTPTNGYGTLKDTVSVRIFADGDIADNVTYHAEVQGYGDSSKTGDYTGDYTQNANIRELYVDIAAGNGWDARLGKQQVVWGTADGMKLLDIINPTDYAEMAQNQMEDSRLPVWALNIESGNTQVVISEPKENVFAGLNRSTDTDVRRNGMMLDDTTLNNGTNTGNAYMMMGPDSITGARNGFLNITPDLGSVATRFGMAFTPTSVTGGGNSYNGQLATLGNLDADSMMGFTVDIFEGMTMAQMNGALANASGGQCTATSTAGVSDLNCIPAGFAGAIGGTWGGLTGSTDDGGMGSEANVQGALGLAAANMTELTGEHMLAFGFQPLYDSALADVEWDANGQSLSGDTVNNVAFDYMGATTFRTFDAFVNAGSQYVYKMPASDEVDFAIKTSQTTNSGVNYSLNFSNSMDKNPIIDLSWRGENGVELITTPVVAPIPDGQGGTYDTTTLFIHDASGNYYGGDEQQTVQNAWITANAADPAAPTPEEMGGAYAAGLSRAATLQFEQSVVRTKNFGGSFDTTVETAGLGPVVVRGEALYTKDSMQPVIDKTKLGYGDLVGALEMVPADRFKFVLGADITVLTNMMISAQYISDRNLDFIDGTTKYTTDYATMHLSNGFNKSIEDKQFYSLFFSKPFGASGQNRWNNIFMSEEGVGENGYWNRFDADFGLTDDLIATVEVNTYGGNANTQFGQLDKSDNMQVGVKLSF